MSRLVAAINSLLPLGRRRAPIHRPSSCLATTSKHFCPSIAASAPHRPTETAFLGALAQLLHSSNLASSLPYRPPIATSTNRPLAQTILFLPLPAPILLPEIATAEPVTDLIPLPQLHITLCIHRRAPTALLLPQHPSCILPIHTQFGFTPIGWVE